MLDLIRFSLFLRGLRLSASKVSRPTTRHGGGGAAVALTSLLPFQRGANKLRFGETLTAALAKALSIWCKTGLSLILQVHSFLSMQISCKFVFFFPRDYRLNPM